MVDDCPVERERLLAQARNDPERFRECIAREVGLARPSDYFRVLGSAMQERIPVDITESEKVDPETRERITRRRRLVCERE